MTPGHAGQRIDRNVGSDCQQERNDRPRLLERRRKSMQVEVLPGEPEEVDNEPEYDQQTTQTPKPFHRRLAISKSPLPQFVRLAMAWSAMAPELAAWPGLEQRNPTRRADSPQTT